eukprot:362640-Chlamydomonas_euryale.AAC.2
MTWMTEGSTHTLSVALNAHPSTALVPTPLLPIALVPTPLLPIALSLSVASFELLEFRTLPCLSSPAPPPLRVSHPAAQIQELVCQAGGVSVNLFYRAPSSVALFCCPVLSPSSLPIPPSLLPHFHCSCLGVTARLPSWRDSCCLLLKGALFCRPLFVALFFTRPTLSPATLPLQLFGRDSEVSKLAAFLSSPGGRVAMVYGPPGEGKLAVAITAMRRLYEEGTAKGGAW